WSGVGCSSSWAPSLRGRRRLRIRTRNAKRRECFSIVSSSLQEEFIEVRPVDGHVAADAFASRRKTQTSVGHALLTVEPRVAFQTKLAGLAPHQHLAGGAAVRVVAGDAARHPRGGMLEHVRAALLNVARDACLPI